MGGNVSVTVVNISKYKVAAVSYLIIDISATVTLSICVVLYVVPS